MNDQHFHPHAAHRGRSDSLRLSDLSVEELPSHLLQTDCDEVQLLLEKLDDVVFSAVSGKDQALEEAQTLWPEVVSRLGWELVEESREQYLLFAIETTKRLEIEESRRPEQAIAALEIISLLTRG